AGVLAAAVDRVLGLGVPERLRDVALAEDDGAGGPQRPRHLAVAAAAYAGQAVDAGTARRPAHPERLLHAHGHALERPPRFAHVDPLRVRDGLGVKRHGAGVLAREIGRAHV